MHSCSTVRFQNLKINVLLTQKIFLEKHVQLDNQLCLTEDQFPLKFIEKKRMMGGLVKTFNNIKNL